VLEDLLVSCLIIMVAEVADRTMLATVSTVLMLGKLFRALAISLLAFTAANAFVVVAAYVFKLFIDIELLNYIASLLFIAFGIIYLLSGREVVRSEGIEKLGLLSLFALIFTSELGDKTQLTVLALALRAYYPIIVLVGAALGYFLINFIAAKLLLDLVRYKGLSIDLLTKAVGVIFILIGVFSLIINVVG